MKAVILAIALAVAWFSPPEASAWEYEDDNASVSFDANALTHLLYVITPESDGVESTDSVLAIQRLRPKFAFTVADWLSFEASYDLMPVSGSALDAVTWAVAPANSLRVADLDETLHVGDGWSLRQNLDRLVFRFTHDKFEVRLGRQAIGHGSARLFSAADLFSNVSPASLDSEFKRGVDGLRLTVPLGESMELEVYALANETEWNDSIYLARWRANFEAIDVSLLAGSSYAQPTLAFDLSGDAFGAGWYLEGMTRIAVGEDDPKTSARVTLGVDYKFSFGLQLTFEGHYNSPGEASPDDYVRAFSTLSATAGESFLLGKWYLGLGLGYELTALLRGQMSWMQNLQDGSALVSAFLAWDFAENVALEVGAMIPVGARVDVSNLIPSPRSEFGLYPLMGFTALRLAL
jgi:hypothetical protein